MPFLEGGSKGASTRNVRPRFSAGVIAGGSSGGGPPAANLLSSFEEKKCASVRWNSAMASSSRGRRFDGVLVMVVDGSKCLLL